MDWQKCNSLFIVVVVVALALVVITRDMLSKAIKTIVAKQLTMPGCSPSHNCLAWPFNCDKFYCRLCFQHFQPTFSTSFKHFQLVQVACADCRLPTTDCRVPCRGTNQLSFKLSNELSIILKDHVSRSN